MNVFSVNQVNQVYVAKNFVENLPTQVGDINVKVTPDGNYLYFQHFGAGGLTRSDLIEVKNILHTKFTEAGAMAPKLAQYAITLDNSVGLIPGQDYLLRLTFDNYVGVSPEDSQYWKYGVVHVFDGMSTSDFWKKMAISLARNLSREAVKLCKITLRQNMGGIEVTSRTKESDLTSTYNGLIIDEVESDWIRGLKQQKTIKISVSTPGVRVGDIYAGDTTELPWAKVKKNEFSTGHNGKLMADFEYFHHGARGDQYRMVGYPDYIPTEYLVDPSEDYNTIGIHFAYIGSNESCQKSEKDITILIPTSKESAQTSLIDAINNVLNEKGITPLEGGTQEEIEDEEDANE